MDKESLVSEVKQGFRCACTSPAYGLRLQAKMRPAREASFKAFPFFVLHNWEAEGQWQRGRLFWVTFFGEAKKVTSCRATPNLQTSKSPRHLTTRREKKPTQNTNHAWAQNPCPPYAIAHKFNPLKAKYKASCASGDITLNLKLSGKPNEVVSRNLIPSDRNFLNNSALSNRLDNGGVAQ